ncbi:MAG: alpha/beta fold hydrolase [Candidatus Binatia bacterium]
MRVAAGGICLNYELQGSGTPLVLTHGLGDSLRYWDEVTPPLAARHAVMRWDVRGFGASDKPAGPYTPSLFAADLAALLDALRLDTVHLAGISMGGVIAQRFALDYPERLRSLILCSTSSEVGPAATANWRRLADRVERVGFEGVQDAVRVFSPGFAADHADIVAAATERAARNDPHAYAAAARAVSDFQWTAELGRVRLPVLILQGLADQLTPPGGSVKMQRALRAARLVMLPDTGHSLPVEQPARFVESVLEFTSAVEAGR